jgi:hypothetical protein
VEYKSVWVSSDGYISVNGPPAAGAKPTGLIAPFERPLNPGQGGHVYYWTGGISDFYIAWDKVPTLTCSTCSTWGNPQSFLLHVYQATDVQNSAFQQSGFEFWYGTVTPGDGIGTSIGINDQYGGRPVAVSPSQNAVNGQALVWKATSGPYYLNHLTITATDTSNGIVDSNAIIIRDPRYTVSPYNLQAGAPTGYHVVLNTNVPGTIQVPEYARTALSIASVVPPITIAGEIISQGAGLTLMIPDTYNSLLAAYYTGSLPTYYDQNNWGDSSPAKMGVSAAQYDAQIPGVVPVDASLSGEMVWLFHDSPRTSPHHLTVTATVGYIGGTGYAQIGGVPDFATVQSSVNLDLNPAYKILSDGFELGGGAFNPHYYTQTDQWTVVSNCPHPGYCFDQNWRAWSGTATGQSNLVLAVGNMQGFSDIVLYLHLWVGVGLNTITISYLSGGSWSSIASYTGSDSDTSPRNIQPYTQWINPRFDLPTTATAIRIANSGCCSSGGLYLDDIYLFGVGSSNSAVAHVWGQVVGGNTHPTPVTMDGGQVTQTPDTVLVPAGSMHTLTAQTQFSDNTGTYGFDYWSLPTSSSYSPTTTVTVSGDLTYTAFYVQIPDFTVIPNPSSLFIAPGGQGTYSIQFTSRAGFTGTVSLSVSVSPQVGSGPSVTVSPTIVSLSGGTGSATVTATVPNNVPFQTYTITLSGTSTSQANGATWNLNIQTSMTLSPGDFTLQSAPSSMTTTDGTTVGISIGVGSQGGFYGTVTVTANGPYGPGNPQTQTTSILSGNYCCLWITTSFNIPTCASGIVQAVVQGTSGSIQHSITVPITVTTNRSCPTYYQLSANPSTINMNQATCWTSTITVTSPGGFSGPVSLQVYSTTIAASFGGCWGSSSPVTVSVTPTTPGTATLTINSCAANPGNYSTTVIGTSTSPPTSSQTALTVTVLASGSSCGPGSAGSLAKGTLITMADGSQVPVQNINVGDKMMGYDTSTGQYTISTVTSVKVVDTSTLLVIHTSTRTPFRTDASPTEVLWTMLQNGTALWLPVTQLNAGDDLWTQNGWVPVLSITYVSTGLHTMYDITATTPYFANGYLDPIHPS